MRICKNCGPQIADKFRVITKHGKTALVCIKCRQDSYTRWRANHPEKVKEISKNRYKTNKGKMNAQYTAWYAENKKARSEYMRQRRIEARFTVLQHYSNGTMKCACCNEHRLEFLVIDHEKGGGKKHRKEIGKRGNAFYSWLIKKNLPDGYRVLCQNCNIGWSTGVCPHQIKRLVS